MKWKDLPVEREDLGKRYLHESIALREQPGKWAILEEYPLSVPRSTPASLARNIAGGKYVSFRPTGDYEAVVHKNRDNNVWEVYVRYVGEDHHHDGT